MSYKLPKDISLNPSYKCLGIGKSERSIQDVSWKDGELNDINILI